MAVNVLSHLLPVSPALVAVGSHYGLCILQIEA